MNEITQNIEEKPPGKSTHKKKFKSKWNELKTNKNTQRIRKRNFHWKETWSENVGNHSKNRRKAVIKRSLKTNKIHYKTNKKF